MKKRILSMILAFIMCISCFQVTVFAGKGEEGPFAYTEAGVYERVSSGLSEYNQRLDSVSVTLPATKTGLNFSYLAVLDGNEYGTGPEMTPLPSGWTVDYLFTYSIIDPTSDGYPTVLSETIPIGMSADTWASEVNQYIDDTYETWKAAETWRLEESKNDYEIACDYTPFLKAKESSLTFSTTGELPLKKDSELYPGGGDVYSDRYYTCIARFRYNEETQYFSSVYQMETKVDFSGPGSQDYTPPVFVGPSDLGDYQKAGEGELTETLDATVSYGSKPITYKWYRSETGEEGSFTEISGATSATYKAPYSDEENKSVYYYAAYSYNDDHNVVQSGKTTTAKLTRGTPSVFAAPAALGNHKKAGEGNLTETLDATASYGSKPITYKWYRSETGTEGSFTEISGATSAIYNAPYSDNENASVYYYATYSYEDDLNIAKTGKTTTATLTRTPYKNFTLTVISSYVDDSLRLPEDFVLPDSLKNCTLSLTSESKSYSYDFAVSNFTAEKKLTLEPADDYVLTVKNTSGKTLYSENFEFSGTTGTHTLGLDNISLFDLKVWFSDAAISKSSTLTTEGLHVDAWKWDNDSCTTIGEPFATGVVGADGLVVWDDYGKELAANGYILCKVRETEIKNDDCRMCFVTDRMTAGSTSYCLNVQPRNGVPAHKATDDSLEGTIYLMRDFSVHVKNIEGMPLRGISVLFTGDDGETKTVVTDVSGNCSANMATYSSTGNVRVDIAAQRTTDGGVWKASDGDYVTVGTEKEISLSGYYEDPLMDVTFKVKTSDGSVVDYADSEYKDAPITLTMNGYDTLKFGNYYVANGLKVSCGDTVRLDATAKLNDSNIARGKATVSFKGPKKEAEVVLTAAPKITLNFLDVDGEEHPGVQRHYIIFDYQNPDTPIYDIITAESSVTVPISLDAGKTICAVCTWDTISETKSKDAYWRKTEDGEFKYIIVPDTDTSYTIKAGFQPISEGFQMENGFRGESSVTLNSNNEWTVIARCYLNRWDSTASNLKDIILLPEGAKNIRTSRGSDTGVTIDAANRKVTVDLYATTGQPYLEIYFDLPQDKMDEDGTCTMEAYAEYDYGYPAEHYTISLGKSIARTSELSVRGQPDISMTNLQENGYQAILRLPYGKDWNVKIYDNDTEIKSLTDVRGTNYINLALAETTGTHEIKFVAEGVITATRTLSVEVKPDNRPVLQSFIVNNHDCTDGSFSVTYNTARPTFTVKAKYTHPEQIEKLWVVGETDADNYYFELTWDETQQAFVGNGKLGTAEQPAYSIWLDMVEKWDTDKVMGNITYDDSLFTDALYFNDSNLVPNSEDPHQAQALADWEKYTYIINHLDDYKTEAALNAALNDLFGADNTWYTPAIYLEDGITTWRQVFHSDEDAVEEALNSHDAITVNINGKDKKGTMKVNSEKGSIEYKGISSMCLPAVLKENNEESSALLTGAISNGMTMKDWYDKGKWAADVWDHWDDPVNDDTADEWLDRLPGIPGAPIYAGGGAAAGKALHSILDKRKDDADRALRGLPPREAKDPRTPTPPLIDPSGYIYEAVESNRLEGVSAGIYYKDDSENWIAWDSETYGQSANPMLSLEDGIYGWDVFPGTWKVIFEKDGYITAESNELTVPPPHLDVNISLVSMAAPKVKSVTSDDNGRVFTLTFDKYMKISDVTAPGAVTFKVGESQVEGILAATNADSVKIGSKQATGTTDLIEDEQVATSFTFTANNPVSGGSTVNVEVSDSVRAYNSKNLTSDYSGTITVPASRNSGGSGGSGGKSTETDDTPIIDNPEINGFVDVNEGDYFYEPVLWAVKNGITNGVDKEHFNPLGITTRAQMVTFMWRGAGSPEPTSGICKFTDIDEDDYYYDAVLWAVEKGITKGIKETQFAPDMTVTRGQTVTFISRFEEGKSKGIENKFTDVDSDTYYADAVMWAVENGITNGTSSNTFSPDKSCTRGEIVTFLYRDSAKL